MTGMTIAELLAQGMSRAGCGKRDAHSRVRPPATRPTKMASRSSAELAAKVNPNRAAFRSLGASTRARLLRTAARARAKALRA